MKIVSIHIYPIKSLGGISLQSAKVLGRGLEHDRRWVLIDREGLFQSQRTFSEMALFSVTITQDALRVKAPNNSIVDIPFEAEGERKRVKIWDDVVEGVEVSSQISAWFSKRLGKEVYLVKMTEETNRLIDVRYASNAETVSFADGYPLLLANTASIDDLNEKLDSPIGVDRFRPNIVIQGENPFEEDDWTHLTIGNAQIEVVKRCARCVVVNINPQTAVKGIEVLQSLSNFRKTGNKVHFGVNALIHNEGVISVGDSAFE